MRVGVQAFLERLLLEQKRGSSCISLCSLKVLIHPVKFLGHVDVVLAPLRQSEQESLNDGITISTILGICIINNHAKLLGVIVNSLD